ncbi:MAG: WXG100 family type VII secretion target [Isosphaeraceae bacterium]|nr:WXG100 family type VII secretion target [Isosphaeraceae bacterium]
MAQAIVDPGELRRFAGNLKQFNTDLQNRMAVLHGQLNGLSQTWRDREQVKFTEEFEQAMVVFARFVEVTNQYIPFLVRKAERIEEYLQQR